MSQITKEMLADRIRSVVSHEVKAFLDQMSHEEAAYQAQIEEFKAQAAAATLKSVADAWKSEAKRLEADRPDTSATRRQAAAMAVLFITNELRLPLQLKGAAQEASKPAKAAAEKSGKRMPRAVMQQLLGNLIKAFPADGSFIRIAELAEKTGADISDVRSALLRLKREGKAESNGRKGKGGAWKRK